MPPRIFIVDDDEAILAAVRVEAEVQDWELGSHPMIAGAMDAVRSFAPDVLVLDVNLPDGDGYEFCRRLRAQPAVARVPVLFLTSNGDIDSRLKGFEVGAQDYVVKPFAPRELSARVKAQLALKSRQDGLERELSKVQVQAAAEDGALGVHRRKVTVLFNDIRGFTKLSETEPMEDLSRLINDYFAAMIDQLNAEQGTFDKFIGDAIMAFWNDPLDQPDHAERAVRCAVRMQRRLAALNEQFRREGRPTLRSGIGIDTGEAMVGNHGSLAHHAYTAMGDHVNIAARLMGQAEPGQILVGAATAAAIPSFKRLYPGARLLPFHLKGKSTPVEAAVLAGSDGP